MLPCLLSVRLLRLMNAGTRVNITFNYIIVVDDHKLWSEGLMTIVTSSGKLLHVGQ